MKLTGETVEVVNIPLDGVNRYFLHVGNTAMEELNTLYKEPKGTMREIQGSFKPFFPTEETETVQVYRDQPLLTNQLQFVIERDGYSRVAYLAKSDFGSLLRGLKMYCKLHKSEM